MAFIGHFPKAVLYDLLYSPQNIYNVCIIAHVDHGKTSLADNLIASNGLINQKQAGRIRYMDYHKEELERGITMKSSCITLGYCVSDCNYLINLIDSPGHIDFSSEVSTAVRLCDGAIIVVDVIEGVCAQTKAVLKQAWNECIQPVLVINKIDRLILEMKLQPVDAYYRIAQVLEQINAFMAELYNTDVLNRLDDNRKLDDSLGKEDLDDSDLYFIPEKGNVVFASAIDSWGFVVQDFADQFSLKLGICKESLASAVWGDFYITAKGGEKHIVPGAREKQKKPLFVSLILENIYKVYEIVKKKELIEISKLAANMNIKLPGTIAKSADYRVILNFLMSSWLPLSKSVLGMIISNLPSAAELSRQKASKLMCSSYCSFSMLPLQTQELQSHFVKCSSCESAPVIVYVSKMFRVNKQCLVHSGTVSNRNIRHVFGIVSEEELEIRRQKIRNKLNEIKNDSKVMNCDDNSANEKILSFDTNVTEVSSKEEHSDILLAFARVYSGSLKSGQKVYVLGPKHDPRKISNCLEEYCTYRDQIPPEVKHVFLGEISSIFLLFGREFHAVESAPVGAIIGIAGLDDVIIKSATLSSTLACPSFTELSHQVVPILRVAVEPQNPKDLPALRKGLKLLNQADPCVQVLLEKSGEYIIVTAGEVHLQKCIDDLENVYAGVPIHASECTVPFRETIIPSPMCDRLNEAIQGDNIIVKKSNEEHLQIIEASSLFVNFKVRATPLPSEVTAFLTQNADLIKILSVIKNSTNVCSSSEDLDELGGLTQEYIGTFNKKTLLDIEDFKQKLQNIVSHCDIEWHNIINNIWSFGPNYCGANILINKSNNCSFFNIWDRSVLHDSGALKLESNLVTGFQLATSAGPLCEEPMMGVAFYIEEFLPVVDTDQSKITVSAGHVVSISKDAFRAAFETNHQRLMYAMYSCVISVNSDVVGKLYSVIGKRQGRVVESDITEGSSSWNVTAYLPVIESINFANEIRKSTSGEAMPQLVFSHWEIVPIDPFWEPQTTEEITHWGEKADSKNIARKYINLIKGRKGLLTSNKLVEFAEKQRTLSKNK